MITGGLYRLSNTFYISSVNSNYHNKMATKIEEFLIVEIQNVSNKKEALRY